MDEFDEKPITGLGGHPGKEETELHLARRNLARPELIHW
jgi:hypothetical protein